MSGETPPEFPRFRFVADFALLVEFGEAVSDEIHEQVLTLDTALARRPFEGFVEAVPAYASLLVRFNPVVTEHSSVQAAIVERMGAQDVVLRGSTLREVLVCYGSDVAPDLAQVSAQTKLSPEEIIEAHSRAHYRVYMYGFAPGYAYLAGVPECLQLPRKPQAVRNIPAGSVVIAGPQCLVSTLTMPTGWWIIGRSPTPILSGDSNRPFLFDVGDEVRFKSISRAEFDRHRAG